jgi:hypothetical protein
VIGAPQIAAPTRRSPRQCAGRRANAPVRYGSGVEKKESNPFFPNQAPTKSTIDRFFAKITRSLPKRRRDQGRSPGFYRNGGETKEDHAIFTETASRKRKSDMIFTETASRKRGSDGILRMGRRD